MVTIGRNTNYVEYLPPPPPPPPPPADSASDRVGPAPASPTQLPRSTESPVPPRLQALRDLVPEAFADGKVDFEKLRVALGDAVSAERERFGLNWPGKLDAMRAVQQSSSGTLVPDRNESVDFDGTEHVFIEGDNLEVLKLLQKSYHGKVKLIYIDPPYNTGGDFVYPDNFHEGLEDYLEFSKQVTSGGYRVSANVESGGRYHSKWLSMMWPRLFLARNLLAEDGLIFVSIDDHESANLRYLMDEVFGAGNSIADVAVVNNLKGRSDDAHIATAHESLLIYARNQQFAALGGLPLPNQMVEEYTEEDQFGKYKLIPLKKSGKGWRQSDRPKMHYPIYVAEDCTKLSLTEFPGAIKVLPMKGEELGRWRWGQETFQARVARDVVAKRVRGGTITVSSKMRLGDPDSGDERSLKAKSVWLDPKFDSAAGGRDLIGVGMGDVFVNPKPVQFLSEILTLATEDSSGTVLDFFAGSATCAHAVLDMNANDGGNRKCILVQLPQPTPEGNPYPTISAIGRERWRRVIAKQKDSTVQANDLGFRAFRLDTSCFKQWDADKAPRDPAGLAAQIALFADQLDPDRSDEAVLVELMLRRGLELSAAIAPVKIGDTTWYTFQDGAIWICPSRRISRAVFDEILARDRADRPQEVIVLDRAFESDEAKANIVQQFLDSAISARPGEVAPSHIDIQVL